VLIDSHCHVYMADFDADRPAVLARARSAGLCALIAVGYDLPSSRQAIDLAEQESDVYACVAIHPHHAEDLTRRPRTAGSVGIASKIGIRRSVWIITKPSLEGRTRSEPSSPRPQRVAPSGSTSGER
jgi:Tat protein secretion system quality control protein TatD with DNase activity